MHKLPILLAILISVSVFFGMGAGLIFDKDFYMQEHKRNGVDVEDPEKLTSDLIGYLQSGERLDHFNDKEKRHLEDVKGLVDKGFALYYGLMIVMLGLCFYLYSKKRLLLSVEKASLYSGAIVLGSIFLAILLSPWFDELFVLFHKIFFDNDLWLLDPSTDVLIRLLPQQFFVDFMALVLVRSALAGIFLLIMGFCLLHVRRGLGSRRRKAPGP